MVHPNSMWFPIPIVNMCHGLSGLVAAADAATPPRCDASRLRKSEATGACVIEAVILSKAARKHPRQQRPSVASRARRGGVSQASSLHTELHGRLSLCRVSCLLLKHIPQKGTAQCTTDVGICTIDDSVRCNSGKF